MRIGIITDIHENVEMLQEAIRLAEAQKCVELACLGDIAGYDRRYYRYNSGRSAKKCLQIIKSSFRWVVAGNHDLFAASRLPVYSNGFIYPDDWFTMKPYKRKLHSEGKVWCYEGDEPHDMGEDDIMYLRSLPEYIATAEPGIPCLFSHYVYPDVTGSSTLYIERNHQLNRLWDFMQDNRLIYSFSGHSHELFTGFAYQGRRSFFKAIHNLPSNSFNLGVEPVMTILPPLTGEKGRTGFAVLDSSTMKLEIISVGSGN